MNIPLSPDFIHFAVVNWNGLTSFDTKILLMKKRQNYGTIDSVSQFVEARSFNNKYHGEKYTLNESRSM